MFAATDKPAQHFGEALAQQVELFPEFGMRRISAGEWIKQMTALKQPKTVEDMFGKDFIICNHCQNVTLRIRLREEQVFTMDDARRLMKSDGFTSYIKGEYSEPGEVKFNG